MNSQLILRRMNLWFRNRANVVKQFEFKLVLEILSTVSDEIHLNMT